MTWAAFVDNELVNVCGLLLSILMLKQIIMSLIDYFTPRCKKPKMFRNHEIQIIAHMDKPKYLHMYNPAELDVAREEHL